MSSEKQVVAKCVSRYVKVSPLKTRRILSQIRRLPVDQAFLVLKLMPYRSCLPILKALCSSVANYKVLFGNEIKMSSLVVIEARADAATFLKRICPHAQGRAFPIKKHYSHIFSAFLMLVLITF